MLVIIHLFVIIIVISLFFTLWTAVPIVSSGRDFRWPNLTNERRTLHLNNIRQKYRICRCNIWLQQTLMNQSGCKSAKSAVNTNHYAAVNLHVSSFMDTFTSALITRDNLPLYFGKHWTLYWHTSPQTRKIANTKYKTEQKCQNSQLRIRVTVKCKYK